MKGMSVTSLAVLGGGLAAVAIGGAAFSLDARLGLLVLALPVGVLMLSSPLVGTTLLLFAMPLEELSAIVPGLPLNRLLGVVVVGMWLLYALVRRRRIRVPGIALPAMGFILWGGASALWAVDLATALRQTGTLLLLFGLYVLVVNVLDTPWAVRRALWAHVAGATTLALFGLYLTSEGVLQGGRTALVVDARLLMEPNFLAAALLLPIAFCLTASIDRGRPNFERVLLLLAAIVCITAILLTMSRGAIVAVVIVAIAVAVARRHFLLPVLGLLLALPGLLMVGPEFWDRWTNALTLADRGAGRLDIWQVGWLVVRSRPFVGVGLGSFPAVYYGYLAEAAGVSPQHAEHIAHVLTMGPHNIYLSAAAELGVVGLVLMVATLLVHLFVAFRTWWRLEAVRHPTAGLALGVAAAVLALSVQGASLDIALRKYFWTALGLAALGARRQPVARAAGTRAEVEVMQPPPVRRYGGVAVR
jgi:O-antigen ligase